MRAHPAWIVFRVELLEFIAQHVRNHPEMTVLFSTLITTDLDRIADQILYLRNYASGVSCG